MPERQDVGGFLLAHSPVDLQGGGGVQTESNSIVNYQGGSFNFGGFEFSDPGFSFFPPGPQPGDLFYDFLNDTLYYYTGDPALGIDGWKELIIDQSTVNAIGGKWNLVSDISVGSGAPGQDIYFDETEYSVGLTDTLDCCCNVTTLTVVQRGIYTVVLGVVWNDWLASGAHSARIHINGSIEAESKVTGATGSAIEQNQATWSGLLDTGDVIKGSAFQDSGCNEPIGRQSDAAKTFLSVTLVTAVPS